MIQFNLLPDVKQQYIRAKRMKRTAVVVSFLVAATALFVFVMLFLSVHVFQQKHIKNVNNDIQASIKTLKETPNLNKILTIQNQLNSLPELHNNKPVVSRMGIYLSQITPDKITIGDIEVDFEANTMVIQGTAESLEKVNKYVDTIKFTTFSEVQTDGSEPIPSKTKPFNSVVLDDYTRSDKEVTYKIILSYDPAIFDNSKNIILVVPKNKITTRSELEKPSDLFKELPKNNKEQ